ncbi:MAG: hypothetical protein HY722_16425 [Planctomycetes bacterium]|nr:hypothetical protein [Planctomycetota bacterium]
MRRRALPAVSLALAAVLVALPAGARADVVTTHDGRRIEGRVLAADGDGVVVELSPGSTVELSAAEVLRIEYGPTPLEVFAERAGALAADDLDGHFGLALWCRHKGLVAQARSELEKVIAVDPDHAEARDLLGYIRKDGVWVQRGPAGPPPPADPAAARAAAQGHLEEALRLAADGRSSAAKEAFRAALGADPTHYEAHVEFALYWIAEGKPRPALDALETAVALDPSRAAAHADLAYVDLLFHRYDHAARSATAALNREPGSRVYLDLAGAVHAYLVRKLIYRKQRDALGKACEVARGAYDEACAAEGMKRLDEEWVSPEEYDRVMAERADLEGRIAEARRAMPGRKRELDLRRELADTRIVEYKREMALAAMRYNEGVYTDVQYQALLLAYQDKIREQKEELKRIEVEASHLNDEVDGLEAMVVGTRRKRSPQAVAVKPDGSRAEGIPPFAFED